MLLRFELTVLRAGFEIRLENSDRIEANFRTPDLGNPRMPPKRRPLRPRGNFGKERSSSTASSSIKLYNLFVSENKILIKNTNLVSGVQKTGGGRVTVFVVV